MKKMRRYAAFLGSAVSLALSSGWLVDHAAGAIVYSETGDADRSRQAHGNNYYQYGDDISLAPGAPRHLDSIALTFGLYADGLFYTPHIVVDVYAIDAVTRLPVGSVLGTAERSDVVFDGTDPTSSGNPGPLQQVAFDFSSQNVILPDHFGFVYRDANPVDPGDPTNLGFSSILTTDPNYSQTQYGIITRYPDDVNQTNWTFGNSDPFGFGGSSDPGGQRNFLAIISASSSLAVPEPSALILAGIAAIGSYSLVRRKRVGSS